MAARFGEAESIYREIINPIPTSDRGSKSELMYEYAEMMMEQKKYEEAEHVARAVFEHRMSRVEAGGQWSQELMMSHRQLSSALCHQDSPAKKNQAIRMHRDIWDDDFPHAWKAENGDRVCQILAQQKRYDDAERMQLEVWEERSRKAGIRDEATMLSASKRIDMMDGAISMLDQSPDEKDVVKDYLEKRIRDFLAVIWESVKLPETDAKMLTFGHRLGEAHYQRNQYAKAGDIFKQVWEGRKKSLGDNHCETLACGQRLGEIYYKRADYTKARDIFEQLCDGEKRSRGDADPKTLESGHLLGEIYFKQDEFEKAQDIFEQVWKRKRKILGNSDPKTLECGHRLGEVYFKQEEFVKAQDMFEQVWKGKRKSTGDTDPKTLEYGHWLGGVHYDRKQYADAEIVFDHVWDGRKSRLGDNDPGTLASGHQLAKSICAQAHGNHAKSFKGLALLEDLWGARKLELEATSPNAVSSNSSLAAVETGYMYGSLLMECGKLREAEEVLKPLWELKVTPAVEASQLYVGHFWGSCLAKQGHYTKAREVLESVLTRKNLISGPEDEIFLETPRKLQEVCEKEKEEKKSPCKRRSGQFVIPKRKSRQKT